MAARDVLKNLNLWVDGRGLAGQVENFTPPQLTLLTEDFRAGGMDMPTEIEMGMEKLEASFNLVSYEANVLALFGVSAGQQVPFVMRGALVSHDGNVSSLAITMRGKIKGINQGTLTPGQKPSLEFTLALNYYKHEQAGNVIHDIDADNMVRVVNGVDQLAAQRSALGL